MDNKGRFVFRKTGSAKMFLTRKTDKHRYSKLKNKCTKKKDKNILESIGLFQELPEDPICVYHEHADDNICNEIDLTHDEEVVLEKSRRKSGSRKQLVPSKLVCNTDGKDQAIESNLTENKNNTTKQKPGETEKHISDANFMASAMKNMTLSEELRKPEEDSVPKRPSNPGTKRKKLNAKNPDTESHPKNSDTVDKQKPKRARKSAFIAADFIFGLSRPFKQLEKGSKQYGKKQASKKHPKPPKHDKEKVEKRESIINAQSSVLKKVQKIAKTSTVSESSECPAENNNATKLPEPEKQNVPATRFGVKNIPEGWQRQIIVRKGGKSAGQFDIYFFSPDGTKLRSRRDVAEYLAKTKSNLRVEDFDFRKKVISNNCSIKLSSTLEDDLRRENTKKT